MPPVPFHRRAFLAFFILAFLVLAPAVIFYTSGYRWNAKKGMIERNGTLILDTQPPDASISLNGEMIPERTPVTLQNVAPGTYHIKLERDGYTSWEKTLDVRPERVTFVNDVWLWPRVSPVLRHEANAHTLAVSPNGRLIAWVETKEGTSQLVMRDQFTALVQGAADDGNSIIKNFSAHSPTGTVQLEWNESSTAILVRDTAGHAWFANRSASGDAQQLSDAVYRWSGGTLVGIRRTMSGGREVVEKTETIIASGQVRRIPLAATVVDEEGDLQLVATTGTSRLSVIERGRPDRHYELPDGSWHFASPNDDAVFVTDGRSWLGFVPGQAESGFVRLPTSASPVFLSHNRNQLALSFSGGELWMSVLPQTEQLLIRLGDALKGIAWHDQGQYVFYATEREVFALGLDARQGRVQTSIASFERIGSLAIGEGFLYIAGKRDGQEGIWELGIE